MYQYCLVVIVLVQLYQFVVVWGQCFKFLIQCGDIVVCVVGDGFEYVVGGGLFGFDFGLVWQDVVGYYVVKVWNGLKVWCGYCDDVG